MNQAEGPAPAQAAGDRALSRTQLLRVLELACMAPSAANGQPWRFEWDGRQLKVFFEQARTPGAVDGEGRATWSLVGTFLECLDVAASRDGFGVRYRLTPPYSEDHPVAIVTFASTPSAHADLAPTLATRFTDRRLYRGGSVETPVFARISTPDRELPGRLHVLPIARCSSELLSYLARSERLLWDWSRYQAEVSKWWRWTIADRDRTRDGLHWATLAVNPLSAQLIRIITSGARALNVARGLGFPALVERNARKLFQSSAGLILTTVNTAEVADLVEIMRRYMRAWLELQRAGIAVQPMSVGSLYVYLDACGGLPADMPPAFAALIRRGAPLLRKAFDCSQAEIPLAMFRTGTPPDGPFPAAMRSLRREVEPLVRFT